MKNQSAFLSLYLMAAMMGGNAMPSESRNINTLTDVDLGNPLKDISKPIPKGMTEFWYNGEKIYALNKKNADRKARNKGLI